MNITVYRNFDYAIDSEAQLIKKTFYSRLGCCWKNGYCLKHAVSAVYIKQLLVLGNTLYGIKLRS